VQFRQQDKAHSAFALLWFVYPVVRRRQQGGGG